MNVLEYEIQTERHVRGAVQNVFILFGKSIAYIDIRI